MPLKTRGTYEPIAVGNAVGTLLPTLDWSLVCLNIKVDEKAQIAREEHAAKDGRTFGSSTVAENGKARVVCVSKVRICCGKRLSVLCSRQQGGKCILPKYTTNKSTTNCMICIDVKYFFH
jgi:hypothetical protein